MANPSDKNQAGGVDPKDTELDADLEVDAEQADKITGGAKDDVVVRMKAL